MKKDIFQANLVKDCVIDICLHQHIRDNMISLYFGGGTIEESSGPSSLSLSYLNHHHHLC